jgi:osmoprotectant transport system substrate-binding protein
MSALRGGLRRRTTKIITVAVVAAVMTMISGCGLGTAGGFLPAAQLAGSLSSVRQLEGQTISIGSKNFSEQIILGKMTGILLKSAGATVDDLTNIPGSAAARQAQLAGQVDIQWEYTGTAWQTYMGEEKPIRDRQGQYEAVRDRDLKENRLVWLPPAPMNNTYSFAITRQSAEKYKITKLSELKKVPVEERTFCIESEFASRQDGFRPMLKTYGLKYGEDVPDRNVKILDTGAIYEATVQGECVFGEVFTTDGRILALDLKVMEDDKRFFPNYNVSPVISQDTLREHPQIADLLNPVAKKLNDETLIRLNARVDVDGESPAAVAEDWLRTEGFIR